MEALLQYNLSDICHPGPFRSDSTYPVLVETKYDGVRLLTYATPDGVVRHWSRSGAEVIGLDASWPSYTALSRALGRPVWVDSELVSGSVEAASGCLRYPERAREGQWTIWAFDCLFGDDDPAPLIERKQRLEHLPQTPHVQIVPHRVCEYPEDVLGLFVEAEMAGLEGIVVKDAYAPHDPGRSRVWQKLKRHETFDLKVIDVVEGSGAHEGTAAALICEHEGHRVRVASGMSTRQRILLWRNKPIGRTCEVKAQERTKKGSLRHPSFVRFRDDLDPIAPDDGPLDRRIGTYFTVRFIGPRCGVTDSRRYEGIKAAERAIEEGPYPKHYAWWAYQRACAGKWGDPVAAMAWHAAERIGIDRMCQGLPNRDLVRARLELKAWDETFAEWSMSA